jgi:hypothetical protein
MSTYIVLRERADLYSECRPMLSLCFRVLTQSEGRPLPQTLRFCRGKKRGRSRAKALGRLRPEWTTHILASHRQLQSCAQSGRPVRAIYSCSRTSAQLAYYNFQSKSVFLWMSRRSAGREASMPCRFAMGRALERTAL